MAKDSGSFDIGMLVAYHNVLVHVFALTSSVLFHKNRDVGSFVLQSRDILEDVIRAFIDQYDIGYIYHEQSGGLPSKKKRKLVDYDGERASKCVLVIGSVLIQDSMTGNLNEHFD